MPIRCLCLQLMVSRRLRLYSIKFVTYHDFDNDPENRKTWFLDGKCELIPRNPEDLAVPVTRFVRPRGTWTIVATVQRTHREPVSLFLFTLTWPATWAAKGYTTFTFGFDDLETCRKWHSLMHERIAFLCQREGLRRGRHTPSSSISGHNLNILGPDGMPPVLRPTLVSLRSRFAAVPEFATPGGDRQEQGQRPHTPPPGGASPCLLSPVSSSAHSMLFHNDGEATPPRSAGITLATSHAQPVPRPAPPSAAPGVAAARGAAGASSSSAYAAGPGAEHATSSRLPAYSGVPLTGHGGGYDSDDEEDGRGGHHGASEKMAARADVNHFSQRWVPWKQTNGVAVYHHEQADDEQGLGGEYMVSAVVRGRPNEVLKVLMCNQANTTLLGPAKSLEVLQENNEDGSGKEVLRIMLEASGSAGMLMAQREMIVERILKVDEAGLYVVMFISCDPPPTAAAAAGSSTPDAADASRSHHAGGDGDPGPHGRGGGGGGSKRGRLLRAGGGLVRWLRGPVRGWVRGGYTITPLEEHNLDNSPESLLTCIIKVDLGGCLSERSWLRGPSRQAGLVDAFLDRILMSIILVRDEVEHKRFSVQPFSLLASNKPAGVDLFARSSTMANRAPPGDNFARPSLAKMSTRMNSHAQPAGLSLPPRTTLRQQQAIPEHREMSTTQLSALAPHTPTEADPLALDMDAIQALSTLEKRFWSDTHTPGNDAPFKVRGPTYLKDRKKIPAGEPQFILASMDMVELPGPVEHVARFIPAVRQSGAPFSLIIHLIIPGTPMLGIVATYVNEQHPDSLGPPPKNPMGQDHDWQPFDFCLHKFMTSSDAVRNTMIKLIPHIADGSWVIKQAVGTTPVILGKALKTTYHMTKQYLEVDIDVSANNVAAYVTGLVRGATKSLIIDMGFVLEGTAPWELPEALLGTIRLNNLDLKYAKKLDLSAEIPLRLAPDVHQSHPVHIRRHSRSRSITKDLPDPSAPPLLARAQRPRPLDFLRPNPRLLDFHHRNDGTEATPPLRTTSAAEDGGVNEPSSPTRDSGPSSGLHHRSSKSMRVREQQEGGGVARGSTGAGSAGGEGPPSRSLSAGLHEQ
ncbi:MAG: hypothetical protein WDW36_004084 [Sanguina aurantia]